MPQNWDDLFAMGSLLAMISWVILIFWPMKRPLWLFPIMRMVPITLLAIIYAVIAALFMFRGEGGFGSIAEVRTLFMHDGLLVAGWLHYLAFDLFVGLWIAEKADMMGMSRLIQAPVLIACFMLGPLGWLCFVIIHSSLTLSRKFSNTKAQV